MSNVLFSLAALWPILATLALIWVAANITVDRRDPVADAADAAERIRQGVDRG